MPELSTPFGGDVTDEVVRAWLNQFEPNEQSYIIPLLTHFHYYNATRVFDLLRNLHTYLVNDEGIKPEHTWYVPFGYVAKSGSAIAYFYRRANGLNQNLFVSADDLGKISFENISAVVILDDFIGSGKNAVNLWDEVVYPLKQRYPHCRFIFACLVGYESGIEFAESHTKLSIVVAERIQRSKQPFNKYSTIYPTDDERLRAKEIIEKYGSRLALKESLGYAETQGLVGFFFSTPNNTLPIFWSSQDNWKPLLPHGELLSDPNPLIGLRDSPEEMMTQNPQSWQVELNALQQYDIAPELAIKILNEFQKTNVVLVLARIINDLEIHQDVFVHLINLIHSLEHAVHEREPVCTALIIPAKHLINTFASSKFLSVKVGFTISDENGVEALAHLIHGLDGAVMINSDGSVVGTILYQDASSTSDMLLPRRFWSAAATSEAGRGLLLLFVGQGRVIVFYNGKRVLSQRHALWHIHSFEIDQLLLKIRSDHKISKSLMIEVLRLAFDLSDQGYGALLSVGDHEKVMTYADIPQTDLNISDHLNLRNPDKRAISNLARQDGATIISGNDEIVSFSVFLRPPVGVSSVEEKGRGSKHHTAAKMSALTEAIMIAVSVDGRVSLYSKGKLLFKMMG